MSVNVKDFRAGDKVRVTLVHEGDVIEASSVLRVRGWGSILPDEEGYTIDVIERARPKVGDVLQTADDVLALPAGSVVVNSHGRALTRHHSRPTLITDQGEERGRPWRTYNGPYRVVYLPE